MILRKLVRKNILNLKAYSSARNEFKGNASVFLDANENPLNGPYNRYPDPLQWKLKEKISKLKDIDTSKIFFGNGSDEPIDLVIRIFCEPGVDNIVAIDPTYGMYQVCADINNVEYRRVKLNEDFTFDAAKLLEVTDVHTKLIFLCSPNNPTGNLMNSNEIEKLLNIFNGILILDEAYIDFAPDASWVSVLDKYPNLIILQTLSKAWGMAAIRLGMAFASTEIIEYFNKVKYPYNINILTQNYVYDELDRVEEKDNWIETLIFQRQYLHDELSKLPIVYKVHHSDANFILVKMSDPNQIYQKLVDKGIIVRNRNTVTLCEGCLRITVGTESENKILLDELKKL